jgi:hypothetical protein
LPKIKKARGGGIAGLSIFKKRTYLRTDFLQKAVHAFVLAEDFDFPSNSSANVSVGKFTTPYCALAAPAKFKATMTETIVTLANRVILKISSEITSLLMTPT